MILFVTLTFLGIFAMTMLGAAVVFAYEKSQDRKLFSQMLRTVEAGTRPPSKELLRLPSAENRTATWIQNLPGMAGLRTTMRYADTDWRPEMFLLSCVAAALAGAFIGTKVDLLGLSTLSTTVFCVIGGMIPIGILNRKRSKNIKAFEAQFPDALDFLTRTLRAGHGFSTGLQMLSLEIADPLGAAVRRVSNELQLGSSLDKAMTSLTEAVPLIDVRFFVSAVVVQRETGGNLGEILGQLASLVRERIRLKGKVGALSAHGRITGLVLLLMPIAVLLILSVMSPEYVAGLTKDPTGQKLLIAAAGGQVLAWFAIKSIVNIKV